MTSTRVNASLRVGLLFLTFLGTIAFFATCGGIVSFGSGLLAGLGTGALPLLANGGLLGALGGVIAWTAALTWILWVASEKKT